MVLPFQRFPSELAVHRLGFLRAPPAIACRRLTRGTRTGRLADRTLVPQVQSVHAGPNGALAAVSDQGDVVAWSADPASTPKLVWPMRRAAWRVRNLSLGLCDLAPPTFPQHALC